MTTAAMLMVRIRGGREPLRQRCNNRSFGGRESLHRLTIQQLSVESETIRKEQRSWWTCTGQCLSFPSNQTNYLVLRTNECKLSLEFFEKESQLFSLHIIYWKMRIEQNAVKGDLKLSLVAALCFLATAEKLLGSANCNGCLMHRYF